MEDDYRHLQPAKLDIIGIETGRERYLVDGWYLAPQIANWRNNLTACSQRHNLYFIAHHDRVAVFQPSFPSHTLGRQPQINILPTLANPNARGTLDPSRPHGINHLIVGQLGSEEILFLSTDSGNVAAYYTACIQDGIEKEPYKFSKEGHSDLVGVRAFFTHWVYESAWGLSIHKHARMLAVSSNKPRHGLPTGVDAAITVFAFALTSSDQNSGRVCNDGITSTQDDESEWNLWVSSAATPAMLPDRSLNWKTRLDAHTCNIPSVSFVNSDDDRAGNYLLSTDIEGITKSWHIWQGKATSTWDFSPPMRGSSNLYHNSRQTLSGWTVLPLDPSSFQVVNTHEEFCGDPEERESLAGCLDITNSLRLIPGHDRSLAADNLLSSSGSDSHEATNEPIDHFDGDFSVDDDDVTPDGLSLEMESNHSTGPGSVEHHVHSSSDEQSQADGGDPDEVGSGDEIVTDELIRLDNQLVGDEDQLPNWPDFGMPGGYDSSDVYELQNGPGGTKKVKLHHSGTLPAFPQPIPGSHGPIIPTLHLSASHLRLFNANCPREASVYCSDLLSFQWPIYYATHPGIDRLNLTQYIPQLGIVVIGTQVGRVAVCSLTRRGPNGPFGLRVDWILPLESQEKKRERPLTHLLGIAVGPVQGHELSRSSSISDNDDELDETWMQDRIDKDGVPITFDPQIVKLGQNTTSNISGGPKHHAPYRPSPTTTRDSRVLSGAKPTRKRTPPVIVRQAWPSRSEVAEASAVDDEQWRGLEYSRRCRLMLTYFDQTVMTYELSRCAPFVGDPAMGRPNWRNRDEFW